MPSRRPERFLTTVLFTDIVGSTEMAAELGDQGWRELVQEHHRIVRAALRRHEGREIDTAGDGFFAVFDAPASAIACALDVVDEVHALGIDIRAGLHVGEVEQIGRKVGGIAVPIGARIMAAADAGEVFVSSTARDLAAGAGLRFDDQGERELKGLPGTWRLYRVTRPQQDVAAAALVSTDRAAQRAAAVRRARARPIWRRHPRASTALVLGLAASIAASGLLTWSPWRPPALRAVGENSLGVIDAGRGEIVKQVEVGDQPGGIALGEGSIWVTNQGSGTVSRIDPKTRAVVDTIDVGKEPAGIAVADGSAWVANSGERTVSRINVATGRVVDTIQVGNGPSAVALARGAVWVTDASDGTLLRIDPATGTHGEATGVGSVPIAAAADESGVWVVSQDGGTVSQFDPRSGIALAPAVPVGARPSAVALGGGSVWVANAGDGSISRVDPASHRVAQVVDVGGVPTGLAVAGSNLWIADSSGAIERLYLQDTSRPVTRIPTSSAPHAITAVGDDVWFVTRAATETHRGGTLRMVSQYGPGVDPLAVPLPEFLSLLGDGLIGYRRVGGLAGNQLAPDLATSIPKPTDGGRTYAFQLRPGLIYSDGSPVRPSDFRFAYERAFQVDGLGGPIGPGPFAALRGADACKEDPKAPCDLSSGIVADDAANTVTFRLTQPDPNFLYALAAPFAHVMPSGSIPSDQVVKAPYPGTGPYQVAQVTDTQVKLVRNQRFRSWDPSIRPDGYPDDILWTAGVTPDEQVKMIESGDADYMVDQIPPDAFPRLRTLHTPQLHVASNTTMYVFMNTKKAPFDRVEVRQAISMAIDRAKVAELRGGSIAATVTCQLLPPNFPAYEPYCPFTLNPGPSGRWTKPNVAAARQLLAKAGIKGTKVVVGPMPPRLTDVGRYMTTLLGELGFKASLVIPKDIDEVFEAAGQGRLVVGGFEYIADFPAPDTFLGQFACKPGDGLVNYCDPAYDALVTEARNLQATDPVAATKKWAEIDRRATDLGLWIPLVNEGSNFVSARIGNYQANLANDILLDQAWVK
jgi:peptide/nickel transport system substrate-binding protein